MQTHVHELHDLTNAEANQIMNMTVEEARARLLSGDPSALRGIEGSFALVVREGSTVRLARSLDRPLRYFLAKRVDGPALIVAHRIDVIQQWLLRHGLADQFHPSYTRMVPAHHLVELQLIGCPDPSPSYTRFFTPQRQHLPPDINELGRRYIGALADELAAWLQRIAQEAPVGVCFSGGIDSGAVFLTTYHVMQRLGLNLGRLKAFTLNLGDGPDIAQARDFLKRLDLELFLEPIEADPNSIDVAEAIRIVEDYKPLDIEAAVMGLALGRGIRQRYPDWHYLIDGDGGDENLKDYPLEENSELTIRSVVNNLMLYHEGWGVGKLKHSLTYSGGLSRSYARTYAPAAHHGFIGFSPFTRPSVVEVAEGIPFITLTDYDVDRLYALKGAVVSHGVRAVTGLEMPVFPKRRFQHGALPVDRLRDRVPAREVELRRQFLALYS